MSNEQTTNAIRTTSPAPAKGTPPSAPFPSTGVQQARSLASGGYEVQPKSLKPVQTQGANTDAVHSAASAGITPGGRALPFADELQTSFGALGGSGRTWAGLAAVADPAATDKAALAQANVAQMRIVATPGNLREMVNLGVSFMCQFGAAALADLAAKTSDIEAFYGEAEAKRSERETGNADFIANLEWQITARKEDTKWMGVVDDNKTVSDGQSSRSRRGPSRKVWALWRARRASPSGPGGARIHAMAPYDADWLAENAARLGAGSARARTRPLTALGPHPESLARAQRLLNR